MADSLSVGGSPTSDSSSYSSLLAGDVAFGRGRRVAMVEEPGRGRLGVWRLPTDEVTLGALLSEVLIDSWEHVTFGRCLQGAVLEAPASHRPQAPIPRVDCRAQHQPGDRSRQCEERWTPTAKRASRPPTTSCRPELAHRGGTAQSRCGRAMVPCRPHEARDPACAASDMRSARVDIIRVGSGSGCSWTVGRGSWSARWTHSPRSAPGEIAMVQIGDTRLYR